MKSEELKEATKDNFGHGQLKTGARVALFIMVLGGVFYLGGSASRGIIGNDLVEIGTLKFRLDIPFDAEKEIYNLLARTSLLIVFGYLLALIGFVTFLFKARLRMKDHPNVFVAVILFAMFIPIEFYTSYLDLRFFFSYVDFQLQLFLGADPGPLRDEMRKLFVERVSGLGGLSAIAILSYYSALAVLVFRPIRANKKQNRISEGTVENAKAEN